MTTAGVVALVTILSVGGLYLVFLLVASYVSVKPPRVPLLLTPAQLGEPQESVALQTSDGLTVRGWWSQGDGDWAVICSHGYLANRCELVPYGPRLRALGASVFYLDFRCHGASDRATCTFGLSEVEDLRAAVGFVQERMPASRIVFFGSSMGAACAARLCAEDKTLAHALILDGPYASLDEAARGFWYVTGFRSLAKFMAPVSRFGRLWVGFSPRKVDMLDVYSRLEKCPTLFLFGTADTVVPLKSAEACVAAKGAGTKVAWFEGASHGQARFSAAERYFAEIACFLRETGLGGNGQATLVEPGQELNV